MIRMKCQPITKFVICCIVTDLNSLHTGNIFMFFFVVCWFFSKSTFLKNSSRNTIRVSNSLDLDHAQQYVGPDLGPNCLQKLSTDDTSR